MLTLYTPNRIRDASVCIKVALDTRGQVPCRGADELSAPGHDTHPTSDSHGGGLRSCMAQPLRGTVPSKARAEGDPSSHVRRRGLGARFNGPSKDFQAVELALRPGTPWTSRRGVTATDGTPEAMSQQEHVKGHGDREPKLADPRIPPALASGQD